MLYKMQNQILLKVGLICQIINNNALNSNMSKEYWKNFNKILDCFFIKLFGNGYLLDDVIAQEYQCIVKYQKSYN